MVKVIASRLCFKFQVNDGRYEGLEGVSGTRIEKLPHRFPPILYQLKLELKPEERLRLEYCILDPGGNEIYNSVVGEITGREGEGFVNTVLEGFVANDVGIFSFVVLKDGIQIADAPFEIIMKGKPTHMKAKSKTN